MSRSKKKISAIFYHFFLIILSILVLFPIFWMISSSLKSLGDVFSYPPKFIPNPVQWENYSEVMKGSLPFPRFLFNSVIISLARTLGVITVSSMAAYAFARLKFPGRNALFLLFMGTLMVPFQVVMIPMFIIIRHLNWVNTYSSLIFPLMFSAFGTFLLRQFFMTLPRELEEAALIDGCSYFKIFYSIIIPLSKPALASLGIFTFVGCWNEFLWPLVIVSDTKMKTVTLGLSLFQGLYFTEWHLLMAATVITSAVPLTLYIFLQRYFVEGITVTGMKA